MKLRRPCIGVFDSGFGGLTVLKELVALVPDADYLYFGDTARLPYGSKSAETVAKYAIGAAHYLEQHGAEMLVIACNTATALALDQITQASGVPVVGVVEPGAERATAASRAGKVVVIGTEATVTSHAYSKALEARGVQAREKACPLLVSNTLTKDKKKHCELRLVSNTGYFLANGEMYCYNLVKLFTGPILW